MWCEGPTTTLRFRLTFSGVNICVGCQSGPLRDVKWTTNPSPALAASYILEQVNPCQWRFTGSVTGTWKSYDLSSSCGVLDRTGNITDITIDLNLSGTTLSLDADYNVGSSQGAEIFEGSTITATPCDGTTVIFNTTVCQGDFNPSSMWDAGYAGGQASVVRI